MQHTRIIDTYPLGRRQASILTFLHLPTTPRTLHSLDGVAFTSFVPPVPFPWDLNWGDCAQTGFKRVLTRLPIPTAILVHS
ncbi:hypothetical protein WG66_015876 [Moniliophthora roreri]|nr:hypothetical protein WG66_015876 [Moniliophthora roreri]